MKLGMEVSLSDENPASSPQKGNSPRFSAHVCCVQAAEWIKMRLAMEVGLGPGDIVLDGEPTPLPKRGRAQQPQCWPMYIVAKRFDGSI